MAVVTVAFSDLDSWLQAQPENTVDTPYELNITGLTASNCGSSYSPSTLGRIIKNNNTKYVDLANTNLPNLSSTRQLFTGCVNLVIAPTIPNNVTDMSETFNQCSSLKTTPVIPSGVTNMSLCFYEASITTAPTLPQTVTNIKRCFDHTLITVPPVIPESVTVMDMCFMHTLIEEMSNIPSSVTDLSYTFAECKNLKFTKAIPNGVTKMDYSFQACESLEHPPIIPDTVTTMKCTFRGCKSLLTPPIISSSVTDISGCYSSIDNPWHPYQGDTLKNESMLYKPIIPSTVTTSTDVFFDVTVDVWGGSTSQIMNNNITDECEYLQITVDTENNRYVPSNTTIYSVSLPNVDTFLNALDENTVDTPYELKVLNIEQSYISLLADKLYQARNRYVDLRYTIYPYYASIRDQYGFLLYDSENLVYPPALPEGITSLISAFGGCTNLKEAPTIPSTVTNLSSTFANCRNLEEVSIPSAVTNLSGTFSGCTGFTTPPTIPSNVTNMSSTFYGCSNLESAPTIPSGVTTIDSCFKNCTFSQAPAIPSSVTSMNNAFEGTNITQVALVPASVTSAVEAFKNCTSLRKINEFQIPLNTLKNNANFQNMFQGCTSLSEIGYVIRESNWHVWRLKFGSNTVEGKVFFDENTSVNIPQTSITKSDLNLPVLTDELWFPHGQEEDDTAVDAKIADILSQKYGVFKKSVIPPDEKTLVLWADDKDHFMTNIEMGGGGSAVDVVEEDNMNPVTSNAVFESLLSKDLQKNGTFGLLGGAKQSNSTNFADLIHEITGSNYGGGLCGGSISTTASSQGIPAGWYNFLYIPHRTGYGGVDNHLYGTLLVFPMTSNTQYFYYIHHINGTVNTAVPSYAVPTSQPSLLPNGSLWIA